MATLLPDPLFDVYDSNGDPISGATAYFYLTGTTTPAVVYSDNGLTTPVTQPVTADSAGRFPTLYEDPTVTYRLKLYDGGGSLIRDIDPLNPTQTTGTAAIADGSVSTAKLATGAVTTVKITDGNVSNAKLADMAQATIKGRAAGAGTGVPVDLTATQATAILNNVVGDSGSGGTKGLVPAPASGDAAANKYLKSDGTWAAPVAPSVPQCIGAAYVTISGTTPTLVSGFNLTCTYGSATGKWNIAFTSAPADANYYPVVLPQKVAANDALSSCISQGTTPTTAGFQLGFADNTAAAQNPVQFRVLVFH